MRLKTVTPRKFINPLLSRKSIDPTKFAEFKEALGKYVNAIREQHAAGQTEPNIVANELKPFIDAFGYRSQVHAQDGQSGIDLTILQDGRPAVIIEAKKAGARDMVTADNVNKKAFHEAILYFMRERDSKNSGIFHIAITDFYNWYIFDAKDFDRMFWRNNTIKNIYNTYIDPNLLGDTTQTFFEAIARELPNLNIDLHLECAHFDVRKKHSEKDLIAIYKLLSEDSLLKTFNPNDANSLNSDFYDELLYILGLEESKEGGKNIIGRSKISQNGSFYENIADKLAQYKKPSDFESVIKLIIIWINRILFLKLLESQIVKWNANKEYKFLLPGKIDQYDRLESLFFDVLAKNIAERNTREFDYVPYLNSSLFEIHNDEKNGITLATLSDAAEIRYYRRTVAKDANGVRKTGNVSTLTYLFEFLDAYDFSNDTGEEIASESKSLISASVLGLIFEKINGYKDGSFYTPSFVTMYMAREVIVKAVIQKFNQEYGWKCQTLVDLHNKIGIDDIPRANALIDGLKICDPAVGSGHFLVSALNEILYIKSYLRILVDEDGKRLSDYSVSLENDELILIDDEGEDLFEYKKGSAKKTRVQKTLFDQKQKIIENCLFGVDINPNSVNICRLRLWIELLKSAYYRKDGTLDTLPNIDINIKCGNSLISRFGVDDDLKTKGIRAEIKNYKSKVTAYKQNTGSKHDVMAAIGAIKEKFAQVLKESQVANKNLYGSLAEYIRHYGYEGLASDLIVKAANWKLMKQETLFGGEKKELGNRKALLKQIAKFYKQVLEVETGKIFSDAFEWRFEFPEVLNDDGDFVGFDVVLSNPPYGVSIVDLARKHLIENVGKVPDHEIYYWFINRGHQILKESGKLSFIIPNTILFNVNAQDYRLQLLKTWSFDEVLDCTDFKIFDGASVNNIILSVEKSDSGTKVWFRNTLDSNSFVDLISNELESCDKKKLVDNNTNWALIFKLPAHVLELVSKIKQASVPLTEYFPATSQGLIAYDKHQGQDRATIKERVFHHPSNENGKYKKWLHGADVKRYKLEWNQKEYIDYGTGIANPRRPEYFLGNRVLVREITNPSIFAAITSDEFYNDPSILIVKDNPESPLSLDTLLAILNSKLATFYHFKSSPKATKGAFPKILVSDLNNFPLPKNISRDVDGKIRNIAQKVHQARDMHVPSEVVKFEDDIDILVYKLYGLSYGDVTVVDPNFSCTEAYYDAG